jgi:hypothetical protein
LTLNDYQDVIITLYNFTDNDYDTDYDLYVKWESEFCPTDTEYDCAPRFGWGSDEACYKVNLPPGNYYIRVVFTDLADWGDLQQNTYSINITCGAFCGNGQIDNFGIVNEQCDKNAEDASAPCNSYEYCDATCQCHDFRPEMAECNYYDYCVNGTSATDLTEPCCEDINTGATSQCCILNGQPSDCSDPDAVRNESVVAKWDYCATNYDITEVCIDADFANHTYMTCPL